MFDICDHPRLLPFSDQLAGVTLVGALSRIKAQVAPLPEALGT
jgi:hypothetical protein